MVAYVAFVAITNIFVGLALARFVFASDSKVLIPELDPIDFDERPSEHVPAANSSRLQSTGLIQGNGSADPTPNELKANEPQREDRTAGNRADTLKSWEDFTQQLREIKDRTFYCRSAQDMKLVREAAKQLSVCAKSWYRQFEKCLNRNELDDATKALVTGIDMSDIEMFAAQCESTISNVDALDFAGDVMEVVGVLEREIELLGGAQRGFARGKKTRSQLSV